MLRGSDHYKLAHRKSGSESARKIQIVKMACEMEVEYCSRNYLELNDLSKQEASSPTFSREGSWQNLSISPAKSRNNGICGYRTSNELCCNGPIFSGSRHQNKALKRKYLISTITNSNSDEDNYREPLELPSKVLMDNTLSWRYIDVINCTTKYSFNHQISHFC